MSASLARVCSYPTLRLRMILIFQYYCLIPTLTPTPILDPVHWHVHAQYVHPDRYRLNHDIRVHCIDNLTSRDFKFFNFEISKLGLELELGLELGLGLLHVLGISGLGLGLGCGFGCGFGLGCGFGVNCQ